MVVVLAAITAMHSRQAAMRWEGGLGSEENLQNGQSCVIMLGLKTPS